jgi:hypothetical protein
VEFEFVSAAVEIKKKIKTISCRLKTNLGCYNGAIFSNQNRFFGDLVHAWKA